MKDTIRQDLQNGMTIQEVCQKYQLTFKQLMKIFNGDRWSARKRITDSTTGELYIHHHSNGYVIQYNHKYYGRYQRLKDAVKVRDYFIYHGWYHNRLDNVCRLVGVDRLDKPRK